MTRVRAVVVLILAGLLLAACGQAGHTGTSAKPLGERLANAKQQLDQSPSLTLDVKAESLPPGVNGLKSATGAITRQPAFKGTVVVAESGLTVSVPVVAVDGKVHAQLFGTWQVIDPKQYGVSDPAALADPANGVSSLLTKTTNLSDGGQIREGNTIVNTIKGTLPASAVTSLISSVTSGQFDVTYGLDGNDRLMSVRVSGPFYGSSTVAYTVDVSGYGQQQTITAP